MMRSIHQENKNPVRKERTETSWQVWDPCWPPVWRMYFKCPEQSMGPPSAPSPVSGDLALSSLDRGTLQSLKVNAAIKPTQTCEARPAKAAEATNNHLGDPHCLSSGATHESFGRRYSKTAELQRTPNSTATKEELEPLRTHGTEKSPGVRDPGMRLGRAQSPMPRALSMN